MPSLRVVVWSTGWIGSLAIGAVHSRPDLELVGVWVHSPEKAGVDAGELAGIGPIGIRATGAFDELVALAPDCVVYTANGPERDAGSIPDYVRLLRAGINVVSVSTPALVYPPAYDPARTASLTEAAVAGRSSFYSSGIEPGFAADELPLLLTTQSRSITSIRASEIFLDHEYPVAFMGPVGAHGGRRARRGDRSNPRALLPACDRPDHHHCEREIEAGTCSAVRTETIGVIKGREAIVIEHVNRMTPDIAPEWPVAAVDGTYRIRIEGDPAISCDMTVGDPGSPTAGGMTSTAMRVVNAIPYVVAADPGLLTSLDLPLTVPAAAFE